MKNEIRKHRNGQSVTINGVNAEIIKATRTGFYKETLAYHVRVFESFPVARIVAETEING